MQIMYIHPKRMDIDEIVHIARDSTSTSQDESRYSYKEKKDKKANNQE